MWLFIKKVILYGILFGVASVLISTLIYGTDKDFFLQYEDERVVDKFLYVNETSGSFNTVFFGSSSIARHIVPDLFDETVGGDIRSFNMGVDGLKDYRMLDFARQTMSKHPELKNVFIELRIPERDRRLNFKNNAVLYAARWDRLGSILDYIDHSDLNDSKRRAEYMRLVRELLYKYSGIGISKYTQLLLGIAPPVESLSSNDFEKLNETKGLAILPDSWPSRTDFLEGLAAGRDPLTYYKKKYLYAEGVIERPADDTYAQEIFELGQSLRAEGRNVYFILSLHPEDIEYLFNVAVLLHQNNFIVFNMADPDVFPEFYELDYQFDWGHLNYEGAKLYTKYLGELYLKVN